MLFSTRRKRILIYLEKYTTWKLIDLLNANTIFKCNFWNVKKEKERIYKERREMQQLSSADVVDGDWSINFWSHNKQSGNNSILAPNFLKRRIFFWNLLQLTCKMHNNQLKLFSLIKKMVKLCYSFTHIKIGVISDNPLKHFFYIQPKNIFIISNLPPNMLFVITN